MLDVKVQKKQKKGEIAFEGELVIDHALQIKEELTKALKSLKEITLHFDKVTRIDFSFIQLLYALRSSAVAAKKNVILGRACREKLMPLFQAYGFAEEGLEQAAPKTGKKAQATCAKT